MAAPECSPPTGSQGWRQTTTKHSSWVFQQMLSHSLKALPVLSPGTGTAIPLRTVHLSPAPANAQPAPPPWLIWEVDSWDWLWLSVLIREAHGARDTALLILLIFLILLILLIPPGDGNQLCPGFHRSFPGPPSNCAMQLSRSSVTPQLCPILEVP